MPFITWNNSLVTGVEQFDEHHLNLVDLLNKTYDDFISGAPDENLGIVLNELVEYSRYHFAAEENWMRMSLYPKLDEHKHDHDKFSQSVLDFQSEFQSGKVNLSLDVLTFLKRWLHNHIMESDAKYGQFNSSLAIPIMHD